ncbi:MAG: hypothetical protein KC503_00275 [Myxococcales bacterium]|nr:hypothetical protein [Myxococcales bacterium]
MKRVLMIALLGAAVVTSGCKDELDEQLAKALAEHDKKKKARGSGGGATEHNATGDDPSASLTHTALMAAKQAGLRQGSFEKAAARPYGATQCERGEIEKLDVLICRYAEAGSAKGAKAKLQAFVGSATTGAVRVRGAVAMVVADRAKSDLKGKGINKLLKAFGGEG